MQTNSIIPTLTSKQLSLVRNEIKHRGHDVLVIRDPGAWKGDSFEFEQFTIHVDGICQVGLKRVIGGSYENRVHEYLTDASYSLELKRVEICFDDFCFTPDYELTELITKNFRIAE